MRESRFWIGLLTGGLLSFAAVGLVNADGPVTALSSQWVNTPIAEQTGTFTFSFDATASANPSNALLGLTSGPQTAYAALSAIVRFSPAGTIDAYNGKAYAALATLNYQAGKIYHVRMVVDVPRTSYSVYVTAPGMAEVTLATNYLFRVAVDGLENFALSGPGTGGSGNLVVTNTAITDSKPSAATRKPRPTPSPVAAVVGTPAPSPRDGIDYRLWYLQQPDGSTVTNTALVGGHKSPYFYLAADGGQAFMDPKTGVTTSGSLHPRTEMRELNADGTEAAWNWNGTNTLAVVGSVTTVGDTRGRIAIAQVFIGTDSIPLCELFYSSRLGGFEILYEEAKGGGEYIDLKAPAPTGTKYYFELSLSKGELAVSINGVVKYTRKPSVSGKTFYFKVGNYDQSAVAGAVSTAPFSIVEAYAVKITHN